MLSPSDRIAIMVNDITRPMPTEFLLEGIFEELRETGLWDDHVTTMVAIGTHGSKTPEELEGMLGKEALQRFQVINHNSKDEGELTYLGETKQGLPIWLNRRVIEASLRNLLLK